MKEKYKERAYWERRKKEVSATYEEVFQQIRAALERGERRGGIILTSLYKRERALEAQSRDIREQLKCYDNFRGKKAVICKLLYAQWFL